MSLITLSDLHKSYVTPQGIVTALESVNLSVEQGEIFGIVGPSGAGKSTLIRCINRLEQPTSGHVIIDGTDITTLPLDALNTFRRRIGMIFQHFYLLSSKTVFENVALPLRLLGNDHASIKHKVEALLGFVGLSEKSANYPNTLSGGQKQRVAIARALASDPDILLCDEATSALDPITTDEILQLIKRSSAEFGLTVVLITHEMDVIKKICDQVAVIEQGRIIEFGNVLSFFKAPQTPMGKSLVRSSLQLDLPEALSRHLGSTPQADNMPLWRIEFSGKATAEPLINEMIQKFGIEINIYQANVDFIHGEIIGILLASIKGDNDAIVKSEAYLTAKNIIVETIGYVAADAFTTL